MKQIIEKATRKPKLTVAVDRVTIKIPEKMEAIEREKVVKYLEFVADEIKRMNLIYTVRGHYHATRSYMR